MARIETLAILASNTGNDYLAEKYGVVIDNISNGTISSQPKKRNLTATPPRGPFGQSVFAHSKKTPS